MNKIKVLLCDDHSIVRAGMKCLLETGQDIEIVGEAENGHQCLREAHRLRPDVLILDLAMPLLNGMETALQICNQLPRTKILVVSSYDDDQHVRRVIDAGIGGYLLKQSAATELLEAVRQVHQGNVFLSPSLVKHLFRPYLKGKERAALSRREAEVLQLIAESYSNKQIAGILLLGDKTVEKHRTSLMDKLGIRGTSRLTHYALAAGSIEERGFGVPASI